MMKLFLYLTFRFRNLKLYKIESDNENDSCFIILYGYRY